jgi:hypothetical protein
LAEIDDRQVHPVCVVCGDVPFKGARDRLRTEQGVRLSVDLYFTLYDRRVSGKLLLHELVAANRIEEDVVKLEV